MNTNQNFNLSITAIIVAAVVIIFSLASSTNPLLWAGVGAVAIFTIFYFQPLVAIFLLAILYPFTQFSFNFGSINLPYSDLVGFMLFGVYALKTLVAMVSGKWKFDRRDYPAIVLFTGFVFAGALSLINVDQALLSSVKYLLRPIVFFYAVYVVLPIYFITTSKTLLNVMKAITVMGTFLAVGGLYTFLTSNLPFPNKQAIPFGFGSFYPLGSNHNALSEILVGVLPIALSFFWLEKDVLKKNLFLTLAGFIAAINVLTFSRAGWISMAVTILLMIYMRYREVIREKYLKPAISILGLSLIPLAISIYAISTTQLVQGSNYNRLKLVDISYSLFKQHPYIGNGVGTFYRSVEQIKAYVIEYGTALDAHGIIFKVIAEMGLLGILFLIFFLIAIFVKMFREYWLVKTTDGSVMTSAFISAAVGMFIFEFFNTSYYLGKLWIFFGLTFAAIKVFGGAGQRMSNYKYQISNEAQNPND